MIRRSFSALLFSLLFFAFQQAQAADITRYDAVDTLWKEFGMTAHPQTLNSNQQTAVFFSDVPYTDAHYNQISSLCLYQVLDCSSQSLFKGEDPITYPALFKIAYGIAKIEDKTNAFDLDQALLQKHSEGALAPRSPAGEVGWHVPYMNKALERGLISDPLEVGTVSEEKFNKILRKLSILRAYYFIVPTYFKGLEITPEDLQEDTFSTLKEVEDSLSIYKELYSDLATRWANGNTPIIERVLLGSAMARLKLMIPRIEAVSADMHAHALYYDGSYPEDLRALFKEHNIKEMVGEGVYDFSNNAAYRKWNIQHSIKNVDKLVLKPGEEFNYWDTMYKGGLDEVKNGWLIVGDKEVWGWGGGLCGTATAIFRGAWMSGLEITERRPHSIYYTDMYKRSEIGLDAAVFQDSPNLRFKNNTGSTIILHTAYNTNKDIVRVQVFGTKHFKNLSFSGPERKGGSYIQSRTFEYADGTKHEEDLYSSYRKIN